MKLSIALVLVLAASLTACSRPKVKETVVERPVIVERPVAATGATAPAGSCMFASQVYSHGAMACQDHAVHQCSNGVWNRTVNAC
jgi:hypothetical protein